VLVDVNADDLAEGDEPWRGIAVNVVQPDGVQPFAFQRAGRGFDRGGLTSIDGAACRPVAAISIQAAAASLSPPFRK